MSQLLSSREPKTAVTILIDGQLLDVGVTSIQPRSKVRGNTERVIHSATTSGSFYSAAICRPRSQSPNRFVVILVALASIQPRSKDRGKVLRL